MTTRPGVTFIVVNTVMLWLATIVASATLWPIYESTAFIILVAVTIPLGTAIAIIGAVWRWPAFVVLLVTVAVFLAVGVPLAVPSKAQGGVLPTLDGLVDLVAGVALGWKQLVTITIPVGSYQALLVPALVLILGTVVVGLSVSIRARYGELGVVAPVVLFIVGTAIGPTYPERPIVIAVALFAIVLLWLVWFRWYRRRAAIRVLLQGASGSDEVRPEGAWAGLRAAFAAALILALASTAAVASATILPPTSDRTVLRTVVVRPFDPQDYVSPLAGFRSFWQPETVGTALFETEGIAPGSRIRLATLDTYDGVVYSVGSSSSESESGTFSRVPFRLDQSAIVGDQLTVTVTVNDYPGVWVPTVGKLEAIEFDGVAAREATSGFFYNDVTGTGAVVGGLTGGTTYVLSGVVPEQPTLSELAVLVPGAAVVPSPAGVPAELVAKLNEYTSGIEGTGSRLVAMLDGLAGDGYISHGVGPDEPASRSGHAADRIAELFTAPRMIGDAEQYAVAAALMAHEIGFAARVVVGFISDAGVVRGGDVSAWIEVNTAQYGWVTIDPVPPFREIPQEEPEENSQVSRPPTIIPPPVVESERLDRQTAPESEQELPPDLDPLVQAIVVVLRVVGVAMLVLAIGLSPFVVIIAAKLRRRRLRRQAPTPTEQISGGWREFHDSLLDHGLVTAASSTRSEIAAVAGGVQSEVLAAVADRAMFAPEDPQPSESDAVWNAVEELDATLDAGLTRWQRIKARVSLRSLGGYSVKNLFKR